MQGTRAEWCDAEALRRLVALLRAWRQRGTVPRTENGAALKPVPPQVVLITGADAVGKRSLVRAALEQVCRGDVNTPALRIHEPCVADCVEKEAACGPCPLLAHGDEQRESADTTSFVDVKGFDDVLRPADTQADHVVLFDRLDLVFPASAAQGSSSDDNNTADDSGTAGASLVLPFGANGGAGIGATNALVSLAGRLAARKFPVFVIVTCQASDGAHGPALHPLLEMAAQVTLSVACPVHDVRREFLTVMVARSSVVPCAVVDTDDVDEPTRRAGRFVSWAAGELSARTGGSTFARLTVLARDLARDRRFHAQVHAAALGEPVTEALARGFAAEVLRRRPNASAPGAALPPEQPHGERVHWDDVVGLDEAKAALRRAADALRPREGDRAPRRTASAMERFNRVHHDPYVSGILLFGLPGTGKTMLAKAMATEASAAFLTANVSDLVHSFVGESERHVRALFAQARKWAPSVVFLDEVQAAFGGGGGGSTRAGHEDRLVATLVEEFDACRDHGAATGSRVLVVAATNVPDHIGRGLLGPGRLELHLHVPPPPPEAMHRIVRSALVRWGWAAHNQESSAGHVIEAEVRAALAARAAALWSASDVATVMNLVGLDLAARLAADAAFADGAGRAAMHRALNAAAPWVEGIGRAAVASVQASGSQMMLMKLRSWRAQVRDYTKLSLGTAAGEE